MALENPSFFKILTVNFNRKIRIPSDFSRQYRQILREGDVTLRVSSGQTWQVKLEITEGDDFEFAGGWSEFAGDAALKFGEFLVFWVAGISVFGVAVYAFTCCKREVPAGDERRIHNIPDTGNAGASGSSESSKSPIYFQITLKKHQQSRLSLLKKFYDAAGLMGKGSVRLLYLPKNRYQDVVLDCKPFVPRIDLTAGWSEFRKANELVYGKSYSFEFMPKKNVIHVIELHG